MKSVYQIAIYAFILWFTIELSYGQNYFQQDVDYSIEAELDTSLKELKVDCKISYTNNSNQDLDQIIFHLWWNSMGDKRSEFANQMLEIGSQKFHFADDRQLGSYFDLNIRNADGIPLNYESYQGKSDIITLKLDSPLGRGETRVIKFDYFLKIPYAFSRFGYIDKTYQFTQWYPKPAVFDKKGWHPMSYLSVGEFYSEIGNFNVDLHVPRHLKLGYTGELVETQFTDIGMLYSIEAKDVHDFAWFGSTEYIIDRDLLTIGNKKIEIEVLHKSKSVEWINALSYAKESLLFYSRHVGEYPYPKMTIVQGNMQNSSAMEYPMITLVNGGGDGHRLDHLINHEIGHNWFYGILASNERDFPWIDEGFTSFYDHKYFKEKYSTNAFDDNIPKFIHHNKSEYSLLQSFVVQLQNSNRNLPIEYDSESVDYLNYMVNNYEKMSMLLDYLESYLSKALFNQCVKVYFEQWKFKHPQPSDVKKTFEDVTGKDLDWFFDGMLRRNKMMDYKLVKSKYSNGILNVTIKNKGILEAPFALSLYDKNGNIIHQKWCDPIHLNLSRDFTFKEENIHRISINGESILLDKNPNDNHHFVSSIVPGIEPVKIKWGIHLEDSKVNEIHFLPAVNYNVYDGLMTGLIISNTTFPTNGFRWFTNVTYGLNSKKVSGIFDIEKDIVGQSKRFRKLTIGLSGRRFDYFKSNQMNSNLGYWKLVPKVAIHFTKGIFQNCELNYKSHIYNQEYMKYTSPDDFLILNNLNVLHQLNFSFEYRKRLTRNEGLIQLEYESYQSDIFDEDKSYLKLSASWKKEINISAHSKFFARLFGAYFIRNSERQSSNYSDIFVRSSIALSSQGFTDYSLENLYIGRTEQTGFVSRQIDEQQGGFKNAFGSSQKIGMSNDYAIMLNLKSDIPIGFLSKSGLRPYLDIAMSSTKSFNRDPLETKFYYSAGLAFEISDIFGFYLPLINSEEIRQAYSGSNLLSRISFKLNLKPFNLWNLADNPGKLVD